MVNWSFLQAGVIDELSLVLAPVTDGSSGSASLFTQMPSTGKGSPVEFTLNKVERIGDNGISPGLHIQNLIDDFSQRMC